MTHPAPMGPPLSPREPRRSGRRAVPSGSGSTSKSPDSPASESTPRSAPTTQRPALTSSNSAGRNKRSKQEENDDPTDEPHKNGANGTALTNGNGRNKRKPKDKDRIVTELAIETLVSKTELLNGDALPDAVEPEEQEGITRCVCGSTGEDEADAGEFMVQCETCDVWQHGLCMGYEAEDQLPKGEYHCEQCRPDLHVDLLKKLSKRARHPSNSSHNTTSVARASRSHSPSHLLKPAKRRNTMNSRDAAYDETLMKEIMEATAAEASAAHNAPSSVNGSVNGPGDGEEVPETGTNGRRKRKRVEDDAASVKRTRSVSTTSDRPAPANMTREETPASVTAAKAATTMPAPPPKISRNRRGGGRKSAVQVQDLASVDGDEAVATTSSNRRAMNSRTKAAASTPARRGQASGSTAHEHGTRRNYSGGTNGAGAASHAPGSSATRAYHNSHAYVVSQQTLLTSWNLPDYLAHLEHILPTDAPQPLEVRASGADSTEKSLERGVKIKWPSKRMSVGDMNKRVRALVEWVGREQASTLERGRRREALEIALKEAAASNHAMPNGESSVTQGSDGPEGNDISMVLDGVPPTDSPVQEKPPRSAPVQPSENQLAQQSTMRMMEELMEELIGFQERFGPGAKSKERDRRTATS